MLMRVGTLSRERKALNDRTTKIISEVKECCEIGLRKYEKLQIHGKIEASFSKELDVNLQTSTCKASKKR